MNAPIDNVHAVGSAWIERNRRRVAACRSFIDGWSPGPMPADWRPTAADPKLIGTGADRVRRDDCDASWWRRQVEIARPR